jgi:hypothetical protein
MSLQSLRSTGGLDFRCRTGGKSPVPETEREIDRPHCVGGIIGSTIMLDAQVSQITVRMNTNAVAARTLTVEHSFSERSGGNLA